MFRLLLSPFRCFFLRFHVCPSSDYFHPFNNKTMTDSNSHNCTQNRKRRRLILAEDLAAISSGNAYHSGESLSWTSAPSDRNPADPSLYPPYADGKLFPLLIVIFFQIKQLGWWFMGKFQS